MSTEDEGSKRIVSASAGFEGAGRLQADTQALRVRAFFPDSEIYASGVVTIRDIRLPLTIQILPETGSPYDIKIIFSYLEGKDSSVNWSVAEKGLNIDIINFNSSWGLTCITRCRWAPMPEDHYYSIL
jgi:hypothetical protein